MAMNCEAFRENIDAYIDGGLESAARLEMERHAEKCAPCMKLLTEARELAELLAEMSEVDVPLQAQAGWRRAVRAEAKKKPYAAWMRSIASVAAALVVLAAGTMGMRMNVDVPVLNESLTASDEPMLLMADMTAYRPGGDQDEEKEARAGVLPVGYVTSGLQSDGSVGNTRSAETEKLAAGQIQPVVLRSAERTIESENYDSDVQWLNDLVFEYGAYFEEREEITGEAGGIGRTAKAVVRVPSERLDDFLMEMDQLGRTVRRSEAAEDVTGRYMDTQSRLDALKMQKEKLTEMLAESTNVEELIAIDDKMTEVIAAMESLEGDLRRWESEQSYSKVILTLCEVFEEKEEAAVPVGLRMKQGFDESLVWLKEFGQDMLVMLATYGPRLIILIPVLALVLAAVCLIRGKKRK